ncbi:MAG: response regulator [Rhodocyclaceae bacterium]|nr:response regulator [Rhodocyclaceae bacterium]MBX3670032.1 response regulator [Rhodocyclaceae bacterium]
MGNERILVVDDEPFNLQIIAECLDGCGYRLSFAETGEQAWGMLLDTRGGFDLVVLDRMMPGMDGMQVLRNMKQDQYLADIPVIMQTAAAAPDQVREGLEAGAYYYLTKPFDPQALVTIVRAALSDALQRNELVHQVERQAEAMRLIMAGEFRFRTLQDAQNLAALAALCAPVPECAVMGLAELMVNAVEHGNLCISYQEKSRLKREDRWRDEIEDRLRQPQYADRWATLSIECRPDEIVYRVEDQGDGFDAAGYLEFDPSRAFDPNGRGIAIAQQLSFQRLEYLGKGNVAVAVVIRPQAE